ncbi:MAG TPA: hypothetical protein PKA64_15670 [Myxococcota bacterium]|nr:hypothetical protein [Myxococcota bacterium]
MFPYVVLAADVVEEIPVSQSAWVLEAGGLFLLFAAVTSILMGILRGADEATGGGRLIGYGAAMAATSGIALYMASQIGGDPIAAMAGAKWMYPLVAIAGSLLYASHTLTRGRSRSGRHVHMSERDAYSRRGYESLSRSDAPSHKAPERRLARARR